MLDHVRSTDVALAPATTRLNLGWVVPGPLDQLTGGYLYDAQMVDGLRARGHRVDVVDLSLRLSYLDPSAGLRLAGVLRANPWDAVVVDELAHPAMVLGLSLGRVGRRPRSTVVALVHHLRCSEPAPRVARWASLLAERTALGGVDLALCTSRTTAAGLRSVLPGGVPIEVVAPGRDLHGDGEAGSAASASAAAPNGLRVLTVAHWTPRKGIVETLRALALAPRGVSLDLVGDPDRDPAYARWVRIELARPELAGRVRVHGRISSDRLAGLYRQADVCLLASRHEGYGIILGEALAAGLPVVATGVGAVPEVVRDGREAELVRPGDVTALARALERLARDPRERHRRASLARERALALPTWGESSARFAAILERTVAQRRPSLGRAPNGKVRGGTL